MLEATQKKLHEASFFFRLLNKESEKFVRHEPEAVGFLLNAFLSAARSVTFALQYEEKDRYDAWFPGWLDKMSQEDQRLLNFLKEQRNYAEKRGGAEVNMVWECVPVTEVKSNHAGHPAYGFSWFGPPGIALPRVGRAVHSFELSGDHQKVTSVCNQYLAILDKLVRDFLQAHSQD